MKKQIYIVEHLEPELFEWCLIEYEHISEIVGKRNLWFTNIKYRDNKKLEKFGKVFSESVKEMKLNWNKVCVLDPEATKTLAFEDAFEYYIFGGILGDYPPKKRTKAELTRFIKKAEVRNIGKKQMSTDNAVYSVKQIAENSKNFNELKFKDKISLKFDKFEFVDLPYRYNVVDGKPFMSKKILAYLKKNGVFR